MGGAAEQLTDHATARGGHTDNDAPSANTHGSGPGVHEELNRRLTTLHPGDARGLAAVLREFPAQHDQILAFAAPVLGNATVMAALANAPMANASPPGAPARSAMDRATALAQLGVEHLGAIESTLAPAYSRAVHAMDTAAVKEIAMQIAGGVAYVAQAQHQIVQLVPDTNVNPRAVKASTTETDPFTPDPTALANAIMQKQGLDAAVTGTVSKLAVQVSPQMFGDQLVAGATEAPPFTRDPAGLLAYEAGLVIELLEEAEAIEALAMPSNSADRTSEPATDAGRRDAVNRLERWKGRPINFMFLVRVLSQRGVWQTMQGIENLSGHTAEQLDQMVTTQAKETGTTADVGTWWDVEDAHDALSYGATDWAVTEGNAMDVFEMLTHAEPVARAGLVRQLDRMGLLDLGPGDVAAVQLEWAYLDGAVLLRSVERCARDLLVRELHANLPGGWSTVREPRSALMPRVHAISGWSSSIGSHLPRYKPLLRAMSSAIMKESPFPVGWLPADANDPMLVEFFKRHWVEPTSDDEP